MKLVTTRLAAFAIASTIFASHVACGGPTLVVQQYDGPLRPQDTISILRVNGGGSVQLLTLDDTDVAVPIAKDTRLHLELLPGRHTVDVVNVTTPNAPPATVAFDAAPGRVYRVAFVASESSSGPTAHVYEVERGGDALLREVTVDPRVRTPR